MSKGDGVYMYGDQRGEDGSGGVDKYDSVLLAGSRIVDHLVFCTKSENRGSTTIRGKKCEEGEPEGIKGAADGFKVLCSLS